MARRGPFYRVVKVNLQDSHFPPQAGIPPYPPPVAVVFHDLRHELAFKIAHFSKPVGHLFKVRENQ